MMGIILEQAETAMKAAKVKAVEIDTLINIAIADAGANVVAFVRMDGARPRSANVTQKKTNTARYLTTPSGDIGKLSQSGGSLYNIEHFNGGLISFPGGIPVKIRMVAPSACRAAPSKMTILLRRLMWMPLAETGD